MQTNTYEGLHIINQKQSITTDELVIEAPLQININTESYTVVMRTPGNDQDLVLGLLYAEDIYFFAKLKWSKAKLKKFVKTTDKKLVFHED